MTLTLWLLALLLGVRHAFEPDHLAAIAVLVTGQTGTRGAVRLGATWGLGHAAALFVVATILTAARATMRESLGNAFEVAIGVILIVLGAWRIATALRLGNKRAHDRASGGAGPSQGPGENSRPFFVGIAHGLAGSGALTAVAASQVPSVFERLAYVAVFGIGAIIGMMALSGIAGRLLERVARRPAVLAGLGAATGALAVLLGLVWLIRFSV